MNREVVGPPPSRMFVLIAVGTALYCLALGIKLGAAVTARRVEQVEVRPAPMPTFPRCQRDAEFLAFDDHGFPYCARLIFHTDASCELQMDPAVGAPHIDISGAANRGAWPRHETEIPRAAGAFLVDGEATPTNEYRLSDTLTVSQPSLFADVLLDGPHWQCALTDTIPRRTECHDYSKGPKL